MTMRQINYFLGIGGLLLSFFFYREAGNIMGDAGLYPKTVITVLAFLSVLLLIQNHFRPLESAKVKMPFKDTRWVVIMGTIFGAGFYIWLVDVVGFYVTSFFFLIIATYLLSGEKKFNPKTLITLTVMATIVVGVVYLAFKVFLKVQTPTGILF